MSISLIKGLREERDTVRPLTEADQGSVEAEPAGHARARTPEREPQS
jgi:hypothetical protein